MRPVRPIEGGHFEKYARLNKIKILFKEEERNCGGDDRTAQASAIRRGLILCRSRRLRDEFLLAAPALG